MLGLRWQSLRILGIVPGRVRLDVPAVRADRARSPTGWRSGIADTARIRPDASCWLGGPLCPCNRRRSGACALGGDLRLVVGRHRRTSRSVASTAFVTVVGFLLSFVGNWVHLSFMLMAAVIAVMWAVAWWLSPGITPARRVYLAAAGTLGLLAGCLVSPYGVGLTIERSRIVSEICQGIIIEWTSVMRAAELGEIRWIPVAVVAVTIAVGSGLWVVHTLRRFGRFAPRARLVVPLALFAVPATFDGRGCHSVSRRGVAGAPPSCGGGDDWACGRYPLAARSGRISVASEGRRILFRPVLGDRIDRYRRRPGSGRRNCGGQGYPTPEAVLAELLPRGCSLFSDAASAAPVILTRPDVKVWIDGRADFYGRQHLVDASRVFATIDPLPPKADCVLLPLHTGTGVASHSRLSWSGMPGGIAWLFLRGTRSGCGPSALGSVDPQSG